MGALYHKKRGTAKNFYMAALFGKLGITAKNFTLFQATAKKTPPKWAELFSYGDSELFLYELVCEDNRSSLYSR